jgi:hypothetical protein
VGKEGNVFVDTMNGQEKATSEPDSFYKQAPAKIQPIPDLGSKGPPPPRDDPFVVSDFSGQKG